MLFTSACQPIRVVSPPLTDPVLQMISYAVVSAPAHRLDPKRPADPVQREVSSVVYPTKPVFTLAPDPFGDDQAVGEALVPVNLSMLFDPSIRGGSSVRNVIEYP